MTQPTPEMVERVCPACHVKLRWSETGAPDDYVGCDCTVVSLEWFRTASAALTQPTPEMVERVAARDCALHWVPPTGGFHHYSAETAHRVCREIAERIDALPAALTASHDDREPSRGVHYQHNSPAMEHLVTNSPPMPDYIGHPVGEWREDCPLCAHDDREPDDPICARCGCFKSAHGEGLRCEPVGWTFTTEEADTIAALRKRVGVKNKALGNAETAIASLEEGALGWEREHGYPFRDELLAEIRAALNDEGQQ